MKIGLFTNSYHPIVSGVVNAVDAMRDGLTARGHEVFVIAPKHSGGLPNEEKVLRYPSIALLRRIDFPLAIPFSRGNTRRLRRLSLDIAHAQHPFLLGNLGSRIARAQNIPLVFTLHTQYEEYAHYAAFGLPGEWIRPLVRRLVAGFVKKCDAIVVPSPSIQGLAVGYGADGKIHSIPNAVSVARCQSGNPEPVLNKYNLADKKIMVFVGRLAPEKNLSLLLRAFARAASQVPEARLLFVGDGPSRKDLEAQTKRLGIFDKTVFAGMVEQSKVPDYLAAASFFVMPSTSEVKPLSILEAMAAGRPVLAVDAPGAGDTITHGEDGLLTQVNETEFADAAVALLTQPATLLRLSMNAAKTAEAFGLSAMAEKLEKLYLRLSHDVHRIKRSSQGNHLEE